MKKPMDSVAEVIRSLRPRQVHVFEGYSPNSIRAIVSRIRDEDEQRSYHTKAVDNGVQVWRLE